jgi:diacylglycerol diphosphate phosphatase/phosphatidate phosphatase
MVNDYTPLIYKNNTDNNNNNQSTTTRQRYMSAEERRVISPERYDEQDDEHQHTAVDLYDNERASNQYNNSKENRRYFNVLGLFSPNPLPNEKTWFSYHYLIDWILAATIIVTSELIFGTIGYLSPYQRFATYWYMNDASIAYPDSPSIVPTWALIIFVFCVPTLIFGLAQIKYRSTHDFHHALMGIFVTEMLTMMFTNAFKLYAGRLRPDFLARCKPDITGMCTSTNLSDVRDGRLSFPSGHSSTSFGAMVFLSCYLFGKFKIFTHNGGQLWKVLIAISPIFVSGFIAISRTRDYHHNFDDILAGTVLGVAMGLIGYHINYPSLFSSQCHQPKNRYYIQAVAENRRK